MTNELLRNAIMRILYRVHPAPVRRPPLSSECEIALGATITTAEFDAEIAALRRAGFIGAGRDGILGHEMYFLTNAGQAEAARAFG